MTSYQIVLACALIACTAALYVDYSKKQGDASTYDDANTNQYFAPSVKTYGSSYNNQYKNKDASINQYNNADYNNQYKNKDTYNNQYNNADYNNQYKNKDTYNNQYNNGKQYNTNYNNQDNYQQNNYDSQVGVYTCGKGDEGKKYEVIGACYAYYECVYGEALYRQCDDYYKFDAYSVKCVADKSCQYVPVAVPGDYSANSYNNYASNKQYNDNKQYNNNQYSDNKYSKNDNNGNQYANNDQKYVQNDKYNNAKEYNAYYNAPSTYQQKNYDSKVGVYTCGKGDEGKKYEVVGACYAYYECVYGEALYRQCDDYYRFDAYIDSYPGQCVADKSCKYDAAAVESTYSGNSYTSYASGQAKASSYAKTKGY